MERAGDKNMTARERSQTVVLGEFMAEESKETSFRSNAKESVLAASESDDGGSALILELPQSRSFGGFPIGNLRSSRRMVFSNCSTHFSRSNFSRSLRCSNEWAIWFKA